MKVNFLNSSLLLIILLLSACNCISPTDPLDGTSWRVSAIHDSPVLEKPILSVEFKDGTVGGSSGCNSYSGEYTIRGINISIESIAMTLMACMDMAVMEQESTFLENLQNAQTFTLSENQLVIFSAGGKSLVLTKLS